MPVRTLRPDLAALTGFHGKKPPARSDRVGVLGATVWTGDS
jgi:hypothetical protein